MCLVYGKEVHNSDDSVGGEILYMFETHGTGQIPSSFERYLVGQIFVADRGYHSLTQLFGVNPSTQN